VTSLTPYPLKHTYVLLWRCTLRYSMARLRQLSNRYILRF